VAVSVAAAHSDDSKPTALAATEAARTSLRVGDVAVMTVRPLLRVHDAIEHIAMMGELRTQTYRTKVSAIPLDWFEGSTSHIEFVLSWGEIGPPQIGFGMETDTKVQ